MSQAGRNFPSNCRPCLSPKDRTSTASRPSTKPGLRDRTLTFCRRLFLYCIEYHRQGAEVNVDIQQLQTDPHRSAMEGCQTQLHTMKSLTAAAAKGVLSSRFSKQRPQIGNEQCKRSSALPSASSIT